MKQFHQGLIRHELFSNPFVNFSCLIFIVQKLRLASSILHYFNSLSTLYFMQGPCGPDIWFIIVIIVACVLGVLLIAVLVYAIIITILYCKPKGKLTLYSASEFFTVGFFFSVSEDTPKSEHIRYSLYAEQLLLSINCYRYT